MLMDILDVVIKEINSTNKSDYSIDDVYFDFERETITNDLDNANVEVLEANKRNVEITTLLNLATKLPDETLMKLIFEQLDLNYEDYKDQIEEKIKEGKVDINEASETLANTEPIEEEVEETPTIE